jgi:hypothetical protein
MVSRRPAYRGDGAGAVAAGREQMAERFVVSLCGWRDGFALEVNLRLEQNDRLALMSFVNPRRHGWNCLHARRREVN